MREREIVIDRPANEASALLGIRNRSVLAAHGWSAGFWTCSDEDPVQKALGALGVREGGSPEDWEFCRLAGARATTRKKTEDAEGMARHGDWVYIFGSHYGEKTGPLRPRRNFVARFNEARIDGRLDDVTIKVEIARGSFKLHRLINDALKGSGLELIEVGAEEARECIQRTREKGIKGKKKWAGRIEEDDWPINIEGVAFRPSGALLLGLRYPVTRDGHPILVELDQIDKLFRDPPNEPAVQHLWVLDNVGSAKEPRGVRGLEWGGGELHVITGSLDSDPEKSVLLHDHPEGERAQSRHHRLTLPEVTLWTGVGAQEVRGALDEEDEKKVEGISVDEDGGVLYVMDDDKIRLRAG
jgi:hypothetical protein